ncbi:MAG: YdcF family protein [Candidatus Saccharimonadota bacterium]
MKWLIIIPLFVISGVIALSIYLQPNDFIGCSTAPTTDSEKCAPADAIVVVSGGDTKARTDAGIRLFNEGWATTLVLSGAAQDTSGPSNAAEMKLQAETAGIPASAIIIDEEAVNTQQNAQNAQTIFKENGFNDVILVTSGYHQRRASLEFNKQADTVTVRNYPVLSDEDWGWYWWATPRGWWLAGGEFAKVIAFHLGVSS